MITASITWGHTFFGICSYFYTQPIRVGEHTDALANLPVVDMYKLCQPPLQCSYQRCECKHKKSLKVIHFQGWTVPLKESPEPFGPKTPQVEPDSWNGPENCSWIQLLLNMARLNYSTISSYLAVIVTAGHRVRGEDPIASGREGRQAETEGKVQTKGALFKAESKRQIQKNPKVQENKVRNTQKS